MKLATFFSGAGGLDLGFKKAGYEIVWANEFDRTIWSTHKKNFPDTFLDTRSIVKIESSDIPDVDGFIGGPPCQSWSEAGAQRGIEDHRGQLFFDYIRILNEKKPLFFLAENVSGILHKKHEVALKNILSSFDDAGYKISYKLLNAVDYGVPQDRKRVFIVGFRKDLNLKMEFPLPFEKKLNLKNAIWDLKDTAVPAEEKNHRNDQVKFPNHEYMIGGFSTMFLSRNRVRTWEQPSFTIQAGGRHAPIHPQAPIMEKIDTDKFTFMSGKESLYRRLSVRECARIQTFPDDFSFDYDSVADGYKMIGNAVPVKLAEVLAMTIQNILAR